MRRSLVCAKVRLVTTFYHIGGLPSCYIHELSGLDGSRDIQEQLTKAFKRMLKACPNDDKEDGLLTDDFGNQRVLYSLRHTYASRRRYQDMSFDDLSVQMGTSVKMLEVPLWRSYLAGCILLGIAPCTAMVLVWGYLSKGNDGHTLVMVAINSLTMLLLFGVLGGFFWVSGSCRIHGRRCCSRLACMLH